MFVPSHDLKNFLGPDWNADYYNYGLDIEDIAKISTQNLSFWKSKDGILTALNELELTHLNNIIKMIMRKDTKYQDRVIFQLLLKEQMRREREGELW